MEDLLLGFVTDAASVIKHQVGLVRLSHLLIPLGQKRADYLFRIVRVHLAPEGLDVESLHALAFDSIVTVCAGATGYRKKLDRRLYLLPIMPKGIDRPASEIRSECVLLLPHRCTVAEPPLPLCPGSTKSSSSARTPRKQSTL